MEAFSFLSLNAKCLAQLAVSCPPSARLRVAVQVGNPDLKALGWAASDPIHSLGTGLFAPEAIYVLLFHT